MNNAVIVLETFVDGSWKNKLMFDIPKKGTRLHIDSNGIVTELSPERRCKTCNGSGSIRYFYAQDESVRADCPICNQGSQKKWDEEIEAWKEFTDKHS